MKATHRLGICCLLFSSAGAYYFPLHAPQRLGVHTKLSASTTQELLSQPACFIVDHLNINHEKGRHDWLKAFYFDVLGCAIDPRKAENLEKGRKTLWANTGIHQFHLSEGTEAQVLDGMVTLAYSDLTAVKSRLANAPAVLESSLFSWTQDEADEAGSSIQVSDPWGTNFLLTENPTAKDQRGTQPGDPSEPLAMTDILIHIPASANIPGIARFYSEILGFPVRQESSDGLILEASPSTKQTLTFRRRVGGPPVAHEEIAEDEEGRPANLGAHISLYVSNMDVAFERAEKLGVVYGA